MTALPAINAGVLLREQGIFEELHCEWTGSEAIEKQMFLPYVIITALTPIVVS